MKHTDKWIHLLTLLRANETLSKAYIVRTICPDIELRKMGKGYKVPQNYIRLLIRAGYLSTIDHRIYTVKKNPDIDLTWRRCKSEDNPLNFT